MNIFATTFHDLCFLATIFHDFSRLMLAIARLAQKYALRVHSDPLAGRDPLWPSAIAGYPISHLGCGRAQGPRSTIGQ